MAKAMLCAIIAVCVWSVGLGSVWAADDDGSKITIVEPKDGAKVGESFPLKYDLVKGSKAAHAHVYLDGKYQKGFDGTFTGVSKGKHEITVTAATQDHKMLAASQTVTVEVKGEEGY